MKKILGLDLGTNSIGWAVIEHERKFSLESEPTEIFKLSKDSNNKPHCGVTIFTEGVKIEKNNESSKAAERTAYRSARRLKFRRKLRKYETLKVLEEYGYCPIGKDELEKWRSYKNPLTRKAENFKHYPKSDAFLYWLNTDNQATKDMRKKQEKNPYFLRDQVSREKIDHSKKEEKYKLGRALYHMAQRRGFLSNRLDVEDKSIIEEHLPSLNALIEEADNSAELMRLFKDYFKDFDKKDEREKQMVTLKRAFDFIIKKNKGVSFEELKTLILKRLNRKEDLGKVKQGILDLTTKIEEEGCETLGQYFYKSYQKKEKIRGQYTAREDHYLFEFKHICRVQELPEEIIKKLKRAIFYQRPLRSQKGLVGKCSFEPTKPRCPASHPLFEEFRMWSFINNIKFKTEDGKWKSISKEEKEKAIPKFFRKSKPSFDFEDLASVIGKDKHYNYKLKRTVIGSPTTAALVNLFGADWKENIYERYTLKINKNGKKKSLETVINDIWHVLFTFDKNEKLVEFAKNKLKLSPKDAIKFSNIRLKTDYARLSISAIKKILPYLRAGHIYSYAVFLANMEKVIDDDIWKVDDNKDFIKEELDKLIENNREENRLLFIVNELLKGCKDQNSVYSEEAKPYYDKRIIEKLKNSFGEKTWEKRNDKKETIDFVSHEFYTQFKKKGGKGEFKKIKRLDEKVKQFIKNNGFCSDERKLDELYPPSAMEVYQKPDRNDDGLLLLGSPMISAIKNPMAMRSLHQLRKLVNTLLKEEIIDEHTHIHIELSRQLNDANKRKAIQRWQKEREDQNKKYKKEIEDLYKAESGNKAPLVTSNDILKYRLWKEQNEKCVYTSKQICICDFIGDKIKFDIEHTIPRSRCNDNSLMNKTLCEIEFNRNIKKNKMPSELSIHDELIRNIEHLGWKKNYENLEPRIKRLRSSARKAVIKENKDKIIQEYQYLTMERDYWKGKYDRFIMTEVSDGFKNSQLVDTGIITKYARSYMKTVFKRVESVKGDMVAEFRKAWGLQDYYEKKDRSNHIHHCVDAITIACMTKDKYNIMAKAWGKEEMELRYEARNIMTASKPWPTFSEDVQTIEKEVLIYHHTPDQVRKQVKKKWRKRNKIVKNIKTGKPIYLQGDTVRGSLHLDTVFGAIKRAVRDENGKVQFDENNNMVLQKDDKGNEQVFYVIRRQLINLKKSEVDNIVDEKVKAKIKAAIEDGSLAITPNDNADNKFKKVWMNKEKGIEIKKVRVYAKAGRGYLSNPIHLRLQRDLSKHEHKQNVYVQNDENYVLAIYEQINKKGKRQRKYELVNMMDAGWYFKESNKGHRKKYGLVPESMKGMPLKAELKKGTMVLLYKNRPKEVHQLSQKELVKRLYKIVGFDGRPRVMLRHHQVAKAAKEITQSSKMDFGNPAEQLSLGVGNLNILVQGIDFRMTNSGNIIFIEK
ncbi:MAG TPA: type II CRISPR RNA-guided endonuclease Cas9 [Bacteroidetes bacterium]|nr:type II CRISPR RNA-guided endonuclease Cas9 [Bacteroidota bacterium]